MDKKEICKHEWRLTTINKDDGTLVYSGSVDNKEIPTDIDPTPHPEFFVIKEVIEMYEYTYFTPKSGRWDKKPLTVFSHREPRPRPKCLPERGENRMGMMVRTK